MSRIKVWTSKGNWSEEISGIDKVGLIKTAICQGEDYLCGYEGKREPHFEMDFCVLEEGVFDVGDSGELLYDFRGYGDVNKAKSFIMPLAVLRRLASSSSILRGAYEALLSAADVPADAGDDYCLLMEFENE